MSRQPRRSTCCDPPCRAGEEGGGHMGGGAALVGEVLGDGGKRGGVHPQDTGGVPSPHALGRVWVEPGWMSWRVGEMNGSVRSWR